MELLEGRPERTWAQSETLNLDLTAGGASRTQQNGTSVEVGLSCRKIKSYFLLPWAWGEIHTRKPSAEPGWMRIPVSSQPPRGNRLASFCLQNPGWREKAVGIKTSRGWRGQAWPEGEVEHDSVLTKASVQLRKWRRKWQPSPELLPGEFHGQRSWAGYSPWDRKELDTTVQLAFTFRSRQCRALVPSGPVWSRGCSVTVTRL